jgi:glucose-6-phosphate-specific signal transduction histidine kinase
MLLARTDNNIDDHAQVTHKVSVQGMAGAARLVLVITDFGAALLAE